MLVSNTALPLLSLAAIVAAAPAPIQERSLNLGFQGFLSALFGKSALAVTRSPFTFSYACDGKWFGWDKAAALTYSCRAQNRLCLVKSRLSGVCDSTCADQLTSCIQSGDAKPDAGPIYTSTQTYGSLPSGWKSAAPYLVAEPTDTRALTGWTQSGMQWNDLNTPQSCIAFCQSGGWPVAGVEYGSECWCGASLLNGAALNIYTQNPLTACSGDSALNCGAHLGLNLFYDATVLTKTTTNFIPIVDVTIQSNGFKATGQCLKETGDGPARLFNGTSFSADDMTSQKCTSFCHSNGFTQAGIEYASQCYCSSSVDLSSAATSDQCNMRCGGSRLETCGGPDALTVYAM